MDWKLIFQLSLFGLAMGIATVFVIPPNVEPAFWLVIFMVCAYAIAKRRSSGRFVHGLLLGLVNSAWITSAHVLFFNRYLAGHAQEAAMMQSMPLPTHPRLMMATTGPVVGLLSGVVIGIMALVAGKVIRRPLVPAGRTAA